MKTYSLLAGILLSFSLSVQAGDLKLWYKQPAGTWVEALPVGNSRMGAMVYGGTAREELQLNDETMWGGSPYRNDKPEALESLPQVRELIFAGKNMEAQDLIQENFYAGKHGMPYQTIGSLIIETPGHEDVGWILKSFRQQKLSNRRTQHLLCYSLPLAIFQPEKPSVQLCFP
jgi:alpha-L-fucosidase 2